MVDSHVHLNLGEYKSDREEVITRAVEGGVTKMVNIGFDIQSSRETIALAERHPCIYGAVGVHPHDAATFNRDVERELGVLLEHPKILAVGEIGLDYYRDLSPREKQRDVFKKQLELARRKNKPVIIHCRDAFDDVVRILEEKRGHRGVFHAFSGDESMARRVLSLGFRLGIGGVVTFHNSRLKDVVAALPPESIVLETDCPYLAPVPFRGKRNEPLYLQHIVPAVASAQGVTCEDVERTTDRVFAEVMGLDAHSAPEIAYKIRNSLYINMTNRCTNMCVFCPREKRPVVRGHDLGLDREPNVGEIIEAVGDVSGLDEVVFCGYGEPVVKLPLLIEVAGILRKRGVRLRLNTNGIGNLFWKRNIIPELKGLIDVISVSLNTSNPEQYMEICRPAFGDKAFPALLEFIRLSAAAGIETICTAVQYPGVDIDACRRLAESLGAQFKARRYNVMG
jgi:TatD DNase family protein